MAAELNQRKTFIVKIIGLGLALFYVISCLIFVQYFRIPGFEKFTSSYIFLFGLLAISSVAVIGLREWGRKLLVVLNTLMLIFIAAHYIPRIDLVPLGYIILNVIVLLYFTQARIKLQFCAAQHASWNKSILLVDDDESIIKTLRPVLLSHGYAVLTAGSGEECLQIAKKQTPDLVILDVILPGIKGREVCQKLKRDPETQKIPVVFLTAKDSPEDLQAEKEVGSDGHITKPVDMKALIEMVQNILCSGAAKKR
jgi:CheY-like chemotaxis protein